MCTTEPPTCNNNGITADISITFCLVPPYSCGACVSRAFSRAKHFSCPICQATIKRSGLSEKSSEEILFARDVHWTKYINEMYE